MSNKFNEKVKLYMEDLVDFVNSRNDGKANIIKVAMQYDRICRGWREIVPDIMLNRMLDDADHPEMECVAMNSVLDCLSNERIMSNVETLIEVYEKIGDKDKFIAKLIPELQ